MITSLLENAVILETIKKEGSLRWRPPSPTLIHGHAPGLSGRRPSSAVHHFGVPSTVTVHQVSLTGALRVRERSECRVIGETEELMEEDNIVVLSDKN